MQPSHVPMRLFAARGTQRVTSGGAHLRALLCQGFSPLLSSGSPQSFFIVPQVSVLLCGHQGVCVYVPSVYSRCVLVYNQLIACDSLCLWEKGGGSSCFCSATATKLITKLLIWKTGPPNSAYEIENTQKKNLEKVMILASEQHFQGGKNHPYCIESRAQPDTEWPWLWAIPVCSSNPLLSVSLNNGEFLAMTPAAKVLNGCGVRSKGHSSWLRACYTTMRT